MKNQNGQTTIEFLLSIGLAFGVLFMFIQISSNYVRGYLVHYATFMASRTFLVYENHNLSDSTTPDTARENAQNVFNSFKLNRFGLSNDNLQVNLRETSEILSPFVGLFSEFRVPGLSFFGMGMKNPIDLKSESFLGRIPMRAECLQNTCETIEDLSGQIDCNNGSLKWATFYDNGC